MGELEKEIQYIKGVGPNRAKLLQKLGIHTLKDLITYYPRDYEDRNKPSEIAYLQDGQEALIEAIPVSKVSEIRTKNKRVVLYKLMVRDSTGTCILTWYNQSYLKNRFKVGEIYKFFGKVKRVGGHIEMMSPVYDLEKTNKNTGKIIPIYPSTYQLSQNTIRQIMENGLNLVKSKLQETMPEFIKQRYQLINYEEAITRIHFPNDFNEFKQARRRLVFEELLSMQLALLTLKNQYMTEEEGISFSKEVKMSDVINQLPFHLTKAQEKVLEEIDRDMEDRKTMNRLLQGDVGSGKTAVSIIASYKAVKSGYQVAIMAPTAILATQHLESFKQLLDPFHIRCELLVSSITKKKKEEILERLENGEIDIIIGTHALLEENVRFKKLGFIVTDEQHRFGVKQRGTIVAKGENPDVLVMTATPIPRTLALILYGDLDISIIDELPPNRKKIDTYAVRKEMEARVNQFIKKQIDEGRQAYIVCPLVEENEEMNLKSVTELAEKYKKEVFKEYRVEYLHGKMKNKEKDEIMMKFKEGEIDILIATTVIEVGVNVPNASIMVVENAERFGLAQLHQLRGRVGRGEYQSFCILKYEGKSETIQKRMKVMTDTNDGFIISEKDLELRGTGEFFGTKQHGMPEFKIANLFEDMPILKEVQKLASQLIDEDPKLEKKENKLLKEMVKEKFHDRLEI
ncbi:MAG TPA: ATP-dependent DNA helicase RecG [Candidatus Merdicola faecigallinarum]|uniref:ATP-dependent DNA helicase RecG n=1 Tax=Candidatus Merdicola faecigallinarum TaxID=2840862 RepID=A0A9D1S9X9_9FIRM|nr:ATP-dependent DNA helicase RecG [Candidatus Merdicola faecigallinarum]